MGANPAFACRLVRNLQGSVAELSFLRCWPPASDGLCAGAALLVEVATQLGRLGFGLQLRNGPSLGVIVLSKTSRAFPARLTQRNSYTIRLRPEPLVAKSAAVAHNRQVSRNTAMASDARFG